MPVQYNPDIPIETFDVIITDECHRSIYGQWRQVLEYFDAFVIGLTATPSKHTLGFFAQNLVAEYPYERSVVDGVNVGYEVYRIRTRVGEQGGSVDAGYAVPVRDKRTRKVRYQWIDEDIEYTAKELDRSVTVPNQIRAVLQAYKDQLFTDLFPGREWVPKTVIFAKDDNHAEEIVHIARQVFAEGNQFCKKITYRVTGESPRDLIQQFRNDPFPRIAVSVDMIATGTDIKPVEVVMFLRDVKSELYFEQMKGRGCRTIPGADLKSVTRDASAKTRFVLIDAVGVTETNKTASQPLERKPGVSFEKLLDQVAQGQRGHDALSSLAGRLAALDREIEDEDREKIAAAAGGKSLSDLAGGLLDAIDPDTVEKAAEARFGTTATDEQYAEVQEELKNTACAPFDDAALRNLLKEIKKRTEIVIDEITTDTVISAEYDLKRGGRRPASSRTSSKRTRTSCSRSRSSTASPTRCSSSPTRRSRISRRSSPPPLGTSPPPMCGGLINGWMPRRSPEPHPTGCSPISSRSSVLRPGRPSSSSPSATGRTSCSSSGSGGRRTPAARSPMSRWNGCASSAIT